MSFHLKNVRFTKSKIVINFKNQGLYDKESDNIAAENCEESSFQEGLPCRDVQGIVKLGVLAEALKRCCGEDCSSM